MKQSNSTSRGLFRSNFGFLMAAIGSAIGLGNLWKFPYLVGMNGGGAFVLVYLAIIFTIGVSILIGEMVIGRRNHLNPFGAYRALDKRFSFVGILGIATAFLIVTYYNIIGGWVLKYIFAYLTGQRALIAQDSQAFFSQFISHPWEPIVWTLVFAVINMLILIRNVDSGIEKASKFIMPVLFILLLIVVIRSITLPGAGAGLEFYMKPDFSKLNFDTLKAALSQVFFSLSLGMGIMVTYGSYMSDDTSIEKMGWTIPAFDTLAALLAGFAIMPAVFAFGLEPGQGPGLMFVTLPLVFNEIPGGSIMAVLFFLLVLFAALSSSISLLEVPNSYLVDEFHWDRKKSMIFLIVATMALSIPESLSNGIWTSKFFGMAFFDFIGYIAESNLMPLAGLFMCIFMGWVWPEEEWSQEVMKNGQTYKMRTYVRFIIKYLAPLAILLIWFNSSGLVNLLD